MDLLSAALNEAGITEELDGFGVSSKFFLNPLSQFSLFNFEHFLDPVEMVQPPSAPQMLLGNNCFGAALYYALHKLLKRIDISNNFQAIQMLFR